MARPLDLPLQLYYIPGNKLNIACGTDGNSLLVKCGGSVQKGSPPPQLNQINIILKI